MRATQGDLGSSFCFCTNTRIFGGGKSVSLYGPQFPVFQNNIYAPGFLMNHKMPAIRGVLT